MPPDDDPALSLALVPSLANNSAPNPSNKERRKRSLPQEIAEGQSIEKRRKAEASSNADPRKKRGPFAGGWKLFLNKMGREITKSLKRNGKFERGATTKAAGEKWRAMGKERQAVRIEALQSHPCEPI